MASKNWVRNTPFFPPTATMPAPRKMEKTIRGRMSALAIDSTGFLGIILTSTSINVGACLISGAAAAPISRPTPGWIIIAAAKPRRIAMAVVPMYITKVFIPIRPSFFKSPKPVIPVTREDKITGTIIILIRLMNIVPTGAIHSFTQGAASGPRISPTTTERIRDAKICTERFIRFPPYKISTIL